MLWRDDNDDYGMSPFDAMDRMFSDFWGNGLETTHSMKTDVIEGDHDYKLQAELPGFNKEDLHVDLKDGNLTISASHKENNDEKDQNGRYIRRERREASYQRSFYVGDEYKPEDIAAKYDNGVLTVTLPKKEAAVEQKEEPKRIEIQ